MKSKICSTCNKTYYQPKNQRGKIWANRKYCSHSCQPAWNKGKYVILNRKFFDDNPTTRGVGSRLSWNWPRGENNWKWKGGVNMRDKHSLFNPDYVNWRTDVFTRDNFKCKIANKDCKGQLQAHHILPWRDYEELRYNVNNGITLCLAHHPRRRAEEKRLSPYFMELVSVSK